MNDPRLTDTGLRNGRSQRPELGRGEKAASKSSSTSSRPNDLLQLHYDPSTGNHQEEVELHRRSNCTGGVHVPSFFNT
ncbi:unnamed protein product [Pleuronectes platessa]|uniref:Uncharacterized protein n=1 Tax=Pleuronectes platessa TaxID=8262 RepID=A0A9N7U778_PLEPL|nr:unnamed protein product [Pleuronectes platessa]